MLQDAVRRKAHHPIPPLSTRLVPNTTPSFGNQTIADQTFTQGEVLINQNALPEATGGNGTLTYALTGLPDGISLSNDRKLTGTQRPPLTKHHA